MIECLFLVVFCPWRLTLSEDDPFLKPVWEDEEDNQKIVLKPKPKLGEAMNRPVHTISRLIQAHDAIAKLEARLGDGSPDIVAGCLSRMALLEATGFIAHYGSAIHHRDLALRDSGLTGSYLAALASGRIRQELRWTGGDFFTESELPDDQYVAFGLSYAKQWRRLSEFSWSKNMLSPTDLIDQLRNIEIGVPDPDVFIDWFYGLPTQHDLPGLLLPAHIVAYGLPGRQREDKIDVAATYVAATLWRNTVYGKFCPLPVWAAPTNLMQKMGSQGGMEFERSFLECVTESALSGLREFERLKIAKEKLDKISKELIKKDKSNVYEAGLMAIREPIVTSAAISQKLNLSAPTTDKIIERLEEYGLLKELTGRKAWRAYAII
jgi:hypothetical protein